MRQLWPKKSTKLTRSTESRVKFLIRIRARSSSSLSIAICNIVIFISETEFKSFVCGFLLFCSYHAREGGILISKYSDRLWLSLLVLCSSCLCSTARCNLWNSKFEFVTLRLIEQFIDNLLDGKIVFNTMIKRLNSLPRAHFWIYPWKKRAADEKTKFWHVCQDSKRDREGVRLLISKDISCRYFIRFLWREMCIRSFIYLRPDWYRIQCLLINVSTLLQINM